MWKMGTGTLGKMQGSRNADSKIIIIIISHSREGKSKNKLFEDEVMRFQRRLSIHNRVKKLCAREEGIFIYFLYQIRTLFDNFIQFI